MYLRCLKRAIDVLVSLTALIVLSPVLLMLTVIGAAVMKGNPFFVQLRAGKIDKKSGEERLFRLIKFRTMNCDKDENGNLLPDEERLGKYGRILRSTSLDELPQLWNILIGEMSVVGPRPLLPQYIPRYSESQRRRHLVRPGLTGYAQIKGRNAVLWEERLAYDAEYVDNVTFLRDVKIVVQTVKFVLKRDGISSSTCITMEEFMGTEAKKVG